MNALLSSIALDGRLADQRFAELGWLLLKVTLALAAAGVVAALLRRRSAATRHDTWSAALVTALVLAPLAALAPPIELAWLPARAEAVVTAPAAAPAPASAPVVAGDVDVAPANPIAAPAEPARTPQAARPAVPPRLPAPRLATLFWMLGAAAVLLRCAIGHLGLRRLVRSAAPLDGDDWQTLLASAMTSSGVTRPVTLRTSAAVSTPVTWGVRRPVLLLPLEAESWPEERRRAALLHELAHVARGDYLAQLLGYVACAIYWFHPLAWMALSGMRREAERACDDRVLAAGTSPPEYAAQLLEVARAAQGLRLNGAVAIGMARPSTLEGRLLAVLDESRPRRVTSPRTRLAVAAALLLALVPFAGLTPVARGSLMPNATLATRLAAARATNVALAGSDETRVAAATPLVTTAGVAAADAGSAAGDVTVNAASDDAATEPDTSSINETVAASPGEELHLDLDTGAGVSITGWDEPRVEVRGRLGGRDWRESRVEVRRTDGGVLVHTWFEPRHGNHSTSHDLTIRVPKRFDLRLESAGGELTMDGVEGDFRGNTGGGEITLTNLRGSARLNTGGGEVRVSDSHLSGSVSTGGGLIVLSRISGGLKGSSGSGPVVYAEADRDSAGSEDAEDAYDAYDANDAYDAYDGGDKRHDAGDLGDVDVDNSGRIRGASRSGRLHVSRAGGEIDLDEAPNGAVLVTGGGDIDVGRAAGLVEANTGGGDIEIGPVAGSVRAGTGAGDVEVTLVDAGGAKQNVEIHSGNGAIRVVLPADFDGTFELETAYTQRFGRATKIITPWDLDHETTTGWDSSGGTPRRYVRANGKAGSGRGGVVRIKTVNGDIEVRRGG